MSEERWDLTLRPTAAQTYEVMLVTGRILVGRCGRALLILQSIFICFLAPLGATLVLCIVLLKSSVFASGEPPVAALPVTLLAFAAVTFWLTRQSYMMIAQSSVRSRFGQAQEAVLDATGITLITQNSRWHTGWHGVELVHGAKQTLVVCISGIAITLPRIALLGPDDASDALETMQRWQEAGQ